MNKRFPSPVDANDTRLCAGLIQAARTLSLLGRAESEAQILRDAAELDPAEETLKAWLESAERVHDREAAAAALRALEKQTDGADARQALKDRRMRFLSTRSGVVPRVAGIMDEFTTASFRPECVFLPLSPDSATHQLEQFEPDFVFVESAWHGNDQAWSRQVSAVSQNLRNMLAWCSKNGVPSIFWNKEDPVHFSTFLPAAALCNFVFTTDMDCIPAYKEALGHGRVFLLPFAAQPQSHNPIATMPRKDAFNFAGSYYLRYPERQRDIKAILDTARDIRPVDIYDRNFGGDHPHYMFPAEYKSMILGKLPFSEIDKAYKGYRYGINMNTIKQSQTMFARRVYELMASNTVVVSNFSRGVRLSFGDLVICSDKRERLAERLRALAADDLYYRKFRLQGLRKVMGEHTYAARLDYILTKISGDLFQPAQCGALIIAQADSQKDADGILAAFARQTYKNKQLFLMTGSDLTATEAKGVVVFKDIEALISQVLDDTKDVAFCGVMHAQDHYGAEYITDLALTARYSDAEGFGKACYYSASLGTLRLENEALRYHETNILPLRAALLRYAHISHDLLERALHDPAQTYVDGYTLMGIDEFNYCQNGADDAAAAVLVDDIDLPFQGVSSADLYATAEVLTPAKARSRPRAADQPVLLAKVFCHGAVVSKSTPLIKRMNGSRLEVLSEINSAKASYLWMKAKLSRKSLGLIDESIISFELKHDLKQAQLVCEFYRADNTKIAHSMLGTGTHSLALPQDCTQLRFGVRVQGIGTAKLSDISFGANKYLPPAIVGQSDTLVLTKQYPAYDDLYKYGFLHARVRGYREAGISVDVFRLNPKADNIYREFENIDVASGDATLLRATLATGKYRHVLVHMLDRQMWDILRDHLDHINVTIWIHGAEIQHWKRREYDFSRMSDSEITLKKKRTDAYLTLWKEVFADESDKVHMVFVSNTLLKEASADVGMAPRTESLSVIHNYVNGSAFPYRPKKIQHRMKILSIRPFSGLKYANDLSAAAIIELSKRHCFKHLEFCIVGDGPDFETETAKIRGFPNVTLRREFLSHIEIAALHADYGIFLNPTRWDSQGVSRDEAMASGLVPVTSNSSSIPEFVDATCAFMAPDGDHVGLADAIEILYDNPERFLRMSEAAARRVRAQSGFEQTIDKELALFKPKLKDISS
jgi:glycosyltransferase involved in cell wall biosynthesis/spore maturation protein CgeB